MAQENLIPLHSNLPDNPVELRLEQSGGEGTQIGFAGTVQNNIQNAHFYVNGVGNNHIQQIDRSLSDLSGEYYNLIIVGDEYYETMLQHGSILLSKDRCLQSPFTLPEIREKFLPLSDNENKEKILAFPTIFAGESHFYTDPLEPPEKQQAFIGFIDDLRIQENGIKIFFSKSYLPPITNKRLQDRSFELAILCRNKLTELHRTHWAIKQVDLLETFGIPKYF